MSRSDWQYAEQDYEEPEELVGEELAEAIEAMHQFNAAYALWLDSGCMCQCWQPITFDDYCDQPGLCPKCFSEYSRQMHAWLHSEEWGL